jgi:hypothetical protein
VRRPGTVAAATVGQLVLLPVLGWLLVRYIRLQPAIARGVLLVAACPSGAMANVYTYLGCSNVALAERRDRDGHRRYRPGPGRVRRVRDRLFPGPGADPARRCFCVPMHAGG